jgi:hypothetical protein
MLHTLIYFKFLKISSQKKNGNPGGKRGKYKEKTEEKKKALKNRIFIVSICYFLLVLKLFQKWVYLARKPICQLVSRIFLSTTPRVI